MLIREGAGQEYTPIQQLIKLVESQVSRDIITTGMPQEYVDFWRNKYYSLIAAAMSMKRFPESPRNFHVGGSMCYWDRRLDRGKVTFDANLKGSVNQPPPKMCAERRLLRQLHLGSLISQEGKFESKREDELNIYEPNLDVVGLVVASDQTTTVRSGEQPEHAYKEERAVLHPCGQCLNLLSHDGLVEPWTRIVMVNDVDRKHLVVEDISIEDLLKSHGDTKKFAGDYKTYIEDLMPDLE